MASIRCISLLLTCYLFTEIYGQTFGFGNCPQVKTKTDFDLSKVIIIINCFLCVL